MTGTFKPASRIFASTPRPVEAGHHEVEHDRIDRLRIGRGQQSHGGVAAIDDEGS